MKKYFLENLSEIEIKLLCERGGLSFENIEMTVKEVLNDVKKFGDRALRKYTEKFDQVSLDSFLVLDSEIVAACNRVPNRIKKAFKLAAKNINKFHKLQLQKGSKLQVMNGVNLAFSFRPIERVGLYIPGGSAPLSSTVLMLGLVAKIAGCREVFICTPPDKNGCVNDLVLFAASLCGVEKIFKVGGAQAIAAMAYGTDSIPKVGKIFGPGNKFVTLAKMFVSIDLLGATCDMPAGPTEVLVIADKFARADFVASDLISQAEHDCDARAVLICDDLKKVDEVFAQIESQIKALPRRKIAKLALKKSFALIVRDVDEALKFSNRFAPEHLILNVSNYKRYVPYVINAGSVFLGQYSCESAGDYASGTNHCLPTLGYAKAFGGVSVSSFMKQITFQELTLQGVKNLADTVEVMADCEGLQGHKRAIQIRKNRL